TVLYPGLIVCVWGAVARGGARPPAGGGTPRRAARGPVRRASPGRGALAHCPAAEVTGRRAAGSPFSVLASGEVSNQIRIRIDNRGAVERRYEIALAETGGLRLLAPENPLVICGGPD